MKKLNIFLVVAVIAASVLSSCNSNSTKMPSLKNQIDSLNYAFGLANGYIRKVMMEIQDKKMREQMPQQAPATPATPIS